MVPIVGRLKFHVDQVHRGIGTGNVDELRTGKHQVIDNVTTVPSPVAFFYIVCMLRKARFVSLAFLV